MDWSDFGRWFDGGDLIAAGAIALSVVALIWSAWTWSRQREYDAAQLQLQKRITEIEEARHGVELARKNEADVRAFLRGDRLIVENRGGAVARNVDVVVTESARMTAPGLFPIAEFLPGDQVEPKLMWVSRAPPPYAATISWDDPRGRQTRTYNLVR